MHDGFRISTIGQRERETFKLSVEVQANLNYTVHFDVHQNQVHCAGERQEMLLIVVILSVQGFLSLAG